MESVRTSALVNDNNAQIIEGLREALSKKDSELSASNSALEAEKEKSKKARQQTGKVRNELKEAKAEIEKLEDEVKSASNVVVSRDDSQSRIDKALFQLDTILQLNEGADKIAVDHLKLVVRTLTGSSENKLLLD